MRPQAHLPAQAEDHVLQRRTTLRNEEPDKVVCCSAVRNQAGGPGIHTHCSAGAPRSNVERRPEHPFNFFESSALRDPAAESLHADDALCCHGYDGYWPSATCTRSTTLLIT